MSTQQYGNHIMEEMQERMFTTNMDSEKIKKLFEICRNRESINAVSGIWVNIAHVREMMTILDNDAPELVELSFIECWLSSLDIFLHKIAFIMQIQKPKHLEVKNWCYTSFNPPKICSMEKDSDVQSTPGFHQYSNEEH